MHTKNKNASYYNRIYACRSPQVLIFMFRKIAELFSEPVPALCFFGSIPVRDNFKESSEKAVIKKQEMKSQL